MDRSSGCISSGARAKETTVANSGSGISYGDGRKPREPVLDRASKPGKTCLWQSPDWICAQAPMVVLPSIHHEALTRARLWGQTYLFFFNEATSRRGSGIARIHSVIPCHGPNCPNLEIACQGFQDWWQRERRKWPQRQGQRPRGQACADHSVPFQILRTQSTVFSFCVCLVIFSLCCSLNCELSRDLQDRWGEGRRAPRGEESQRNHANISDWRAFYPSKPVFLLKSHCLKKKSKEGRKGRNEGAKKRERNERKKRKRHELWV